MNSRVMSPTPFPSTGQPHVFVHVKRPEWGRAVLLREDSHGRFYLFEDGAERRFGQSHEQSLLNTVTLPADEYEAIIKKLRIPAKAASSVKSKAPRGTVAKAAKPAKAVPTFEQQLDQFLASFPLGFQDPGYVARERGEDASDAKFKEGASALAKRELDATRIDALVEQKDFAEVYASAARVVAAAGVLLNFFDKVAFKKLPQESHAGFAVALQAMLRADAPSESVFDQLVQALEAAEPTWTMVTALPALFDPQRHLFVQPSFMVEQAQIVDVPCGAKGKLNGSRYLAFLDVAAAVKQRLVAAGLSPRDNLDVQTFVWKTLSKNKNPKAAKAAGAAANVSAAD